MKAATAISRASSSRARSPSVRSSSASRSASALCRSSASSAAFVRASSSEASCSRRSTSSRRLSSSAARAATASPSAVISARSFSISAWRPSRSDDSCSSRASSSVCERSRSSSSGARRSRSCCSVSSARVRSSSRAASSLASASARASSSSRRPSSASRAESVCSRVGQLRSRPLDSRDVVGIREPVLDRREPAPLGAQEPNAPAEAPFLKRELALQPVELALALGHRLGAIAQDLLQLIELVARPTLVLFALEKPLRHRGSNLHALCGRVGEEYDPGEMGVRAALACAVAVLVTAAAASGGSVIATPISSDPYTNRVQPAPHPGRAGLLRLRRHGRRGVPDRALRERRRRRQQHRLGDDDGRGPNLDDRDAAGDDRLPGRPVVADQRPRCRVRPAPRRLDDLDAHVRDGRSPPSAPPAGSWSAARRTGA